ncbi:MAG: response regulator [Rhodospirillales bacterium]|nr:response regulator [Rhodospirillales bacterium]
MTHLTRIMHVDDEPDIRDVARLALETLGGFTIESCASGDEAIAKAPAFKPDLFLFDEMMPGLDGPTTLRRIREIAGLENTPAIFMTAQAMPGDIERFKALGALDVIAKPFDPMTLAEQVRTIWAQNRG